MRSTLECFPTVNVALSDMSCFPISLEHASIILIATNPHFALVVGKPTVTNGACPCWSLKHTCHLTCNIIECTSLANTVTAASLKLKQRWSSPIIGRHLAPSQFTYPLSGSCSSSCISYWPDTLQVQENAPVVHSAWTLHSAKVFLIQAESIQAESESNLLMQGPLASCKCHGQCEIFTPVFNKCKNMLKQEACQKERVLLNAKKCWLN